MATVTSHTTERRHTPDRRVNSPRMARNTTAASTGSRMSTLDWVAMALLVVGGINWGLIGLFSFDLVAAIFGTMSPLSRLIYTLVGLSALYSIYTSTKMAGRKNY